MGWTVLYIAFGVVALWLLGEVLLQYKARLRWRVLAFCGFLFVVLGVLLPSVPVIVAGALAFAVGQTYVTLSFRRGFSTGWAIGGNPGASRRRRSGAPAQAGPTLEVTDLSYDEPGAGHHGPGEHPETAAESTAVYEPLPMPDDTGQYGVYGTDHDTAPADAGYDPAAYAPYGAGHDQQGYEQPVHQQGYDYGAAGQQQYAAYSDPYIGPGTDAQQYGSYYGDPYAPSYTYDTPPGGVWVPQQRDTEPDPGQRAPGPYGHEPHQDEQYRY